MTNTKHTPAPWFHNLNKGNKHAPFCIHDSKDRVLAVAHDPDLKWEERAKNACLIAAAPELLEALEYARERLIITQGSSEPKIDATIAKAKGE